MSFSPKRIAFFVLGALIVLAVGLYGLLGSGGQGSATELSLTAASAGGLATSGPAGVSSSTTSTTEPKIYVQVAGEVRKPGVYQVQAGTRVFEAVELAGGMTTKADPQAIALAGVLADGATIVVPAKGENVAGPVQGASGSPAGAPGVGASGSQAKVSLSRATVAELDTLPGVGPKTAERIIAYREEHGGFSSVEQLTEVSGIGTSTYERLKDLVVP